VTGSARNTLWARSLVDELGRAGVRDVVVAPGSRSTPLVLAVAADDRFRTRVHLDERSAGFFALGVGKATGRPAAVITTSGTAVANLLPAVVEASQSGVPLLVLSADRPPRLLGADANQAIEQAGIFGAYPRETFHLGLPELEGRPLRHLRTVAARAVAASLAPDPGPVHINVPFEKPFEPADVSDDFLLDHPLASRGRPDGAPFAVIGTMRPRASEAQLGELAAWCAPERTPPRGVLVAGPSEDADRLGPAVLALAAELGWPVLADPLSGARYGPAGDAHVVAGYDLFLRNATVREQLAPDLVVRVGASPTSASLQEWLLYHSGVTHVVLDDTGRWKDHGATATHYLRVDPVDALTRLSERIATAELDVGWAAGWRLADRAARAALAEAGADVAAAENEGVLVARVLDALPPRTGLVVSSSMPIRDLDAYGVPRDVEVSGFANRAASGIDGVVSTAFGVASQRAEPTVCVIGDVAFFHDRNGLLWSREPDAPVVFVLVDNDGGGIFHMLPVAEHEPHFTRFFATPHGVDLRFAAEAHGLDFVDAVGQNLAAEVRSALKRGRSCVVRVRTERAANHKAHMETRDAVVRSVIEALGQRQT
jgi:2-succinyl-5-enolpyruvyl-6-hydroxy-3-cyclohexene-1-carboxylate synthase